MKCLSIGRAGAISAVIGAIGGLALFSPGLLAQDSASQNEIAAIKAALLETQPDLPISEVLPSHIAGIYEVVLDNRQVIYVSADAKFFIAGDIYEALPEGLVNRSEEKRNVLRAARINALDETGMIIFAPAGEPESTITVFTDVDCPYCRQFHAEIERFNELGIAVRYLAYPRTGLDTETHLKMASAWCADNPAAMLTSAKRGGEVPVAECDDPVAEHYQLGREVGVTGTPALVLEDGAILPGYIPADELAALLAERAQ